MMELQARAVPDNLGLSQKRSMSATIGRYRRCRPFVGIGQHDDVLDDNLLVRIEYLGEVLVKLRLFMLQF